MALFNFFQDGLGWEKAADRSWLASTPGVLPADDVVQQGEQALRFISSRVLPRGGCARGEIYFRSAFMAFVGICCLLVTVQRCMVQFLWNTGHCGEHFRRSICWSLIVNSSLCFLQKVLAGMPEARQVANQWKTLACTIAWSTHFLKGIEYEDKDNPLNSPLPGFFLQGNKLIWRERCVYSLLRSHFS